MRPQQIIARKRDGGTLTTEQIDAFVAGVCDGSWADYQVTALVMAMFINGLDLNEQEALTHAMLHSGEVLDLSDIDRPKADKHSTGGVGDKTSLMIAPLAAACGLAVPMISGRALGHTGGTLDKLESIPGYNVNLKLDRFREVIRDCGFAMSGQTAEIAPADRKLYALRDATATVPYIPLIVGSIMSKKLAEGLDALVLDVKTGSGAFMQSHEDALRLAEAMVETGRSFGVMTQAVVSDMGQPLGKFAGNAHEVYECIVIMRGEAEAEMRTAAELSIDLTARMIRLAGITSDLDSAIDLARRKLADGSALECFRRNLELQGGSPSVCDDPGVLLTAGLTECVIEAASDGFISAIDTFRIGNALVEIGGGRTRADEDIDHAVGFASLAAVGREVKAGDAMGVAYCRNSDQAALVRQKLAAAYTIAEEPPPATRLITAVIGAE